MQISCKQAFSCMNESYLKLLLWTFKQVRHFLNITKPTQSMKNVFHNLTQSQQIEIFKRTEKLLPVLGAMFSFPYQAKSCTFVSMAVVSMQTTVWQFCFNILKRLIRVTSKKSLLCFFLGFILKYLSYYYKIRLRLDLSSAILSRLL